MAWVPVAVIPVHRTPTSHRGSWSGDHYLELRKHAEQVELLEFPIYFGADGLVGYYQRKWLREMEAAVARLEGDGLRPRVAVVFRTDNLVLTGGVRPGFPTDVIMRVEDPADAARRIEQARSAGDWSHVPDTLEASDFVVDLGNHSADQYEHMRWSVRALMLDPTAPRYLDCLVKSAQNVLRVIRDEFNLLADRVELSLHAKDRWLHFLTDGECYWKPIAEISGDQNDQGSSGLSTYPAPYRRLHNIAVRANVVHAFSAAGLPCIPRIWLPSSLRKFYAAAFGGGEWCT